MQPRPRSFPRRTLALLPALALGVALLAPLPALADSDRGWFGKALWGEKEDEHERGEYEHEEREGHEQERGQRAAARNATYDSECGACHLPYPPGMLPSTAWERTMGGLADHFGENAMLAPPVRDELAAYLLRNAGRDGAAEPLRITERRWFRHEHDELGPGALEVAGVPSMAQCDGCHGDAQQWGFAERALKAPESAYAR